MLQACFYCGNPITNPDDLYPVSSYPHDFAPTLAGKVEPGVECFACERCYTREDKKAERKFERYAKKHRTGPPVPILEIPIKLKVKVTLGKPRHVA